MAIAFKRDSLIFAGKVVLIWVLLNIPAAFLATPLILANMQNRLLVEVVGTILNLITFPIALWLMFRRSKLDSSSKYERGLFAYFALVLFGVLGIIGNTTWEHLAAFAATLILTYLALVLLSGKKSFA